MRSIDRQRRLTPRILGTLLGFGFLPTPIRAYSVDSPRAWHGGRALEVGAYPLDLGRIQPLAEHGPSATPGGDARWQRPSVLTASPTAALAPRAAMAIQAISAERRR